MDSDAEHFKRSNSRFMHVIQCANFKKPPQNHGFLAMPLYFGSFLIFKNRQFSNLYAKEQCVYMDRTPLFITYTTFSADPIYTLQSDSLPCELSRCIPCCWGEGPAFAVRWTGDLSRQQLQYHFPHAIYLSRSASS